MMVSTGCSICKISNVFSVKTCGMIQRNVKHTEDTDKHIQQQVNVYRLELMLLLMGMSYYKTEGVAVSERRGVILQSMDAVLVQCQCLACLGGKTGHSAKMFNLAQLLQQCSAATSSSTMFLKHTVCIVLHKGSLTQNNEDKRCSLMTS